MTNNLSVKESELKPIYNCQKSYYGKAIVYDCTFYSKTTGEITGEWAILKSYDTYVAAINLEKELFYRLWDGYRVTTQKHINDFRAQYDFPIIGKKEWENMETWYIRNIADFKNVYAN